MKRILVFVLTLVLLVIGCIGCGGTGGESGENSGGSGDASKSGKLKVCVFNGGYGRTWLDNMITSYTTINKKVSISVENTVTPIETRDMVQSGTSKYDIVFLNVDFFNVAKNNKLASLKSVYDAIPSGETKTIREKAGESVVNYYTQNDDIYQMSWTSGITGLVYNETVLDEIFGKGQWSVPVTTNELIDFADAIKGKGVYPFSFTSDEDYWDYCLFGWVAQYMGIDAYYDYFKGYYTDNSGTKIFASKEKVGEFLAATGVGKEKGLELLEKLTKKSNGYCHEKCDVMTFSEAQNTFLGFGFNGDMTKVAMMPNGDWLENEAQVWLAQKPQSIKMMKLPVISSIIDNCKTINSEETLKSVIAYVDGNSQDKPEGVSDEDINRINEARNTYHSLGLTAAVAIPASSRNQALAKDFLIYMCSDQAQQIYSQALNGLTMNYGYNPEGVSTIKMGTLARSVIDCYGNSGNPIPYVDNSSNLVSYGSLYLMNNKYATLLFTGDKTASQICTGIKNDLSNRWEIILKSSGIN